MKRALVAMLAVLLTLLGTGYSGSSSLNIDEQQAEPAQLELIAPAQSATEEEGNAEPEEPREPDYSSGDDLVATGVLMEACSVADSGKSLCFCVFVYNVQPGVSIDYATGDSWEAEESPSADDPAVEGYIGNKKSLVFHLPTCPNLPAERNQVIFGTREEAVTAGYHPCGNCKP